MMSDSRLTIRQESREGFKSECRLGEDTRHAKLSTLRSAPRRGLDRGHASPCPALAVEGSVSTSFYGCHGLKVRKNSHGCIPDLAVRRQKVVGDVGSGGRLHAKSRANRMLQCHSNETMTTNTSCRARSQNGGSTPPAAFRAHTNACAAHQTMGNRDDSDELAERVESLEATIQALVKGHIQDRLQTLTTRVIELEQENEVQQQELSELQNRLDLFTDISENSKSTPELRAAHLRDALVKNAEAGDDHAIFNYHEVMTTLVDRGHGKIHKPQAYTAIEDAAEKEGFRVTTAKSKHGNEVRAIGVNLDEIPGYTPSNEITTRGEASAPQKSHSNTIETTAN